MIELTFVSTEKMAAVLELGDRAASSMLEELGSGYTKDKTEDKTEDNAEDGESDEESLNGWPTWTVYGVGSGIVAGRFCFCLDDNLFMSLPSERGIVRAINKAVNRLNVEARELNLRVHI